MDPIKAYMGDDMLPSNDVKVCKRASWFVLYDDNLHNRSYVHPLLRYVIVEEGEKILENIIEGVYSFHLWGKALAITAL